MVVILERLSLETIIIYFLIYLGIYIIIGVMRENAKKELAVQPTEELMKRYKLFNKIFKWFPIVYVIFVIVTLGT
jgi:hypothetical protein